MSCINFPENPSLNDTFSFGDNVWNWNGTKYVWVNGRWDPNPKGKVWIPGKWMKTSHGWLWEPGHWK